MFTPNSVVASFLWWTPERRILECFIASLPMLLLKAGSYVPLTLHAFIMWANAVYDKMFWFPVPKAQFSVCNWMFSICALKTKGFQKPSRTTYSYCPFCILTLPKLLEWSLFFFFLSFFLCLYLTHILTGRVYCGATLFPFIGLWGTNLQIVNVLHLNKF